jgi:nucleotide-binding universal stress UspA family protein
MKLLAAYDGSECGRRALEDLRRAGLPETGEALSLTVADVWEPSRSDSDIPAVTKAVLTIVQRAREQAALRIAETQSLAQQGAQILREMFPGWVVHAESIADSPGWGVVRRAEEWKPDLVVVGSHGYSAVGRFFLGSVSQRVVTDAPCSVRVARGRAVAADQPIRLLVGVDGSENAEAALKSVGTRHWPQGTQARLAIVLDERVITRIVSPDYALMRWAAQEEEEAYDWAARMLSELSEPLTQKGLEVSWVVLEGDPKRRLVEEAERWEADCLFVGARGMRAVERFLLGSVSAAVAERAHCSVEVVR